MLRATFFGGWRLKDQIVEVVVAMEYKSDLCLLDEHAAKDTYGIIF